VHWSTLSTYPPSRHQQSLLLSRTLKLACLPRPRASRPELQYRPFSRPLPARRLTPPRPPSSPSPSPADRLLQRAPPNPNPTCPGIAIGREWPPLIRRRRPSAVRRTPVSSPCSMRGARLGHCASTGCAGLAVRTDSTYPRWFRQPPAGNSLVLPNRRPSTSGLRPKLGRQPHYALKAPAYGLRLSWTTCSGQQHIGPHRLSRPALHHSSRGLKVPHRAETNPDRKFLRDTPNNMANCWGQIRGLIYAMK